MENNEKNIEKYFDDILLITKYITNKIDNINEDSDKNNNENYIKENLFKYTDKQKYFNEKGTKLLNESEFQNIISILENYISFDDYIIPFFEKLNIYLIKIIINGYIFYNIDSNKNKEILKLINYFIPLIKNSNYIYFIYNKLSKIFRLELNEENLSNVNNSFSKFCKIFEIWKLIFNYADDLKLNEKYISFYGNNNIEIKINNIDLNYVSTMINITFIKSSLLPINDNIENSSLIKIYDSSGKFFELKLKDIKFKENKNISYLNSIRFVISEGKLVYILNDIDSTKEEIKNDNIKNIGKIELLNNFYGKISLIEYVRKFKKRIVAITKITPDKNGIKKKFDFGKETFSNQYKPLPNNQNPNIKENIEINLKNNKNIFTKYYPIEEDSLSNIKYYGGFEAFIPILKILKYFILHIDNKEQIIFYIKDILKIIINKIYSSQSNLKNFNDIIIPLTGALSEITSVLGKEEKEKLFNDNDIYVLYTFVILSPLPKTAKDIFKNILGLDDIDKLNINYKAIFERKFLKINSIDWYCFVLFAHIEFILLIYNDIEKVPKELFEQLHEIFNNLKNSNKDNDIYKNIDAIQKTKILIIIQFFIGIVNYFYPDKIENFKEFKKIDDLYEFINGASFINKYLVHLCSLMIKIFLELNNLKILKNTEEDSAYHKFYTLFLTLKNIFIINDIDNPEQKKEKEELKNLFKDSFINYEKNKKLIYTILNINENEQNDKNSIEFISEEEKAINEFIDYERQYRHLMKEQFIFNHFWSNKKLFFEENKRSMELKYKLINYYTENFQRPVIYPSLDYRLQYPSFSYFVLDNNFYVKEESKDNYNFSLESQALEDLIEKNNQDNLSLIKEKYKDRIIVYDVCLIKRTHHVKGKLFLIKKGNKIKKIFFLSHSKTMVDNVPSCNYLENNTQQQEFRQTIQNKHVCYGSFFICPDKDCNIKIQINIEDIRMILRRIYFYRKSGLEIFTSNKSYYFNFHENPLMENYEENMAESNLINVISLLTNSFNTDLVPIDINNKVIGYSRELYFETLDNIPVKKASIPNQNIKNKEKDKNNKEEIKEENKFIDNLLKRWINENNHYGYINNEISTFDFIILLNLISNRSYNDLYQYPVFPLLFFYDKKENDVNEYTLVPRTLNSHIGFQTDTKSGEARKKQYINSYEMTKEEINDGISDIPEAYYFNTNYSNGIYISNYLLRIFPYSFIAIEIQGDGFDDPNRLFHSIEHTFYNISCKNTDLREVIPEFYYLPEMFLNINKINFKKKNGDIQIDNVDIPKDILENNNNENGCFKFIEYMRNFLEKKYLEIFNWINLIFGNKQKYNNKNKLDQYFRSETYFTFDKEDDDKLKSYLKNDVIMSSVEFGLIPIQILFNDKEIEENATSNYFYIDKENIKSKLNINVYKDKKYVIKLKKDSENINEITKIYIFKKGSKNIKIISNDLGKIEVYINDKLMTEFYDHKDKIKYIFYNKRLNMFATTSLDGYSCIYSNPNKLLSMIKHPNKGYFDYILLSSNPFPLVIAFDKTNNDFYSFSLSGIFINKVNLNKLIGDLDKVNDKINIYPLFNTDGGAGKDLIIIQTNKGYHVAINLPFFEKEIDFVDNNIIH